MEHVDQYRVHCTDCQSHWTHSIAAKKAFAISDIDKSTLKPSVERTGILPDLQSFMVCPLLNEDQLIGFLEIASTQKNALNNAFVEVMSTVTPLFSVALNRSIVEYHNKIDSLIQSEFTAVHPSVKWKFQEVATRMLESQILGQRAEEEEVTFSGVLPLFAQADIMGSSTARNEAIKKDMLKQIHAAESVFEKADQYESLPIYAHLKHRLHKIALDLDNGLSAGEETVLNELLRNEIYPAFKHLSSLHPQLSRAVENYRKMLNEDLGIIYEQRKNYEDDVTTISSYLSEYIDERQDEAQEAFPHYFEKFVTDGVEMNMYIGASIYPKKRFDTVYYDNLKLWQLETLIGMEHIHHLKRQQLHLGLHIRSLILAHTEPISIRFRKEEKRFDVDGAYNMRYEIIKKRIDKATIKGSNERLTKEGTIAIVYSNEEDARKYKRFASFLHSKGLLSDNVEQHNLNDLHGASGLKALLFYIDYSLAHASKKVATLQAGVHNT